MRTDHWTRVLTNVARHGYSPVWELRGQRQPALAYSVGLTATCGCPDVLLFGLDMDAAAALVHRVVRAYRGRRRFTDGAMLCDDGSRALAFRDVQPVVAELYACLAFKHGRQAGVTPVFQQLVLADASGRFPWQAGYAAGWEQPRLWNDTTSAERELAATV